MKRAHPPNNDGSYPDGKRRRIHHRLQHTQPIHVDPAVTPQDELFFKSQMLRAISLHLRAIGFDSVKPTALEAFRAEVEEYMLHFLSLVKQSMSSSRRTQSIPQDFIHALVHMGIKPSSLIQHLDLPTLPLITQPPIPPPPPAEPPPPDLEGLLGPELSGAKDKAERNYIPSHFPNFPSKHTWQETPVYTEREKDPRKIRERATEEGILAEQALRKLMAASKSGLQKRGGTRDKQSGQQKSEQMWAETMATVQQDEQASLTRDMDIDFGYDGAADGKKTAAEEQLEGGVLVNYDRRYWRKAAQTATWAS
ncbi:hypothetical protein AOQ84DRAFT_288561 [Glonium stellatum]|uniref:Transcription initiation factor TFIID subunit 8 n=1 Tax=Glonium stellatum TaxID=574774 RepID=A0A8E2JV33_9PEZI|nr:hypothetical protein AOQ84DRAFT_288561 [Glonium stellatum]